MAPKPQGTHLRRVVHFYTQ